jgi:hypothetical protein
VGGLGLPGEDVVVAVGLAAYCRGLLLYDVKFYLCGGQIGEVTPPHTLLSG